MIETRLVEMMTVYRKALAELVARRPHDYPWVNEQGIDPFIEKVRTRVAVEGATAVNIDNPAWRRTLALLGIHRTHRAFNAWLGIVKVKPEMQRVVPY